MIDLDRRSILAIDTALDDCSAALLDPVAGILASRSERIGRGHAERLPSIIDETLAEAGVGFSDIGKIGVNIGPGSFTGLRVGVAAARGYALALGVPVVGVTTLAVMAEKVRDKAPVLAVHDAKRGEVYALVMADDGRVLKGPAALVPEALADFIVSIEGPIELAGSGALIAADALAMGQTTIRNAISEIDIEIAARLAALLEPQDTVSPLYLRSPDAKPPSRPFSLFEPNR